jgi:hypothetical protein
MNEQYIKQLEESNEKLHNALGRERFMRDVEKRRRERAYRVEIQHIDNLHLHKADEDNGFTFPGEMGKGYGYTYTALGITAARNIIRSHLFMRDQSDGGLLGAGITWVIQARERMDHPYASGERPSPVTLKGWIVIGHKYPAWGGNRVSNRYFESRYNITEMHFDSYTEYAKWVMKQERMK